MKIYQNFKKFLEQRGWWKIFTYLFFGGLTTVVNIVVFAICHGIFSWNWQISNSLAWLLSVLFAFVTNKLWVFHSKTATWRALTWEFSKFIIARVASYVIDMGCMYLFINLLSTNDLVAKVITQVVVVVINYFLSKIIIFKS
ncbi:GtrA family protein [Lapidilactobacillus dextrinicus]|uniref:GtrA family protein n=1 Tax=Lapidilactobacillus dextrinicus TaxID=51664 RepID=UPI003F1E66A3